MIARISLPIFAFSAVLGCCVYKPVCGFAGGSTFVIHPRRNRLSQEAAANNRVTRFSSTDGVMEPSTTSLDQSPTFGLYEVQEQLLVDRGAYEETIMNEHVESLQAHNPKGSGTSGGFASVANSKSRNSKSKQRSVTTSKTSQSQLQQIGRAHAQVLQRDGVVRIDNVLSKSAAEALRTWVFDHRDESIRLMEQGEIQSLDRFADVLLKSNRCDLTLPLGPAPVMDALFQVLCQSAVSDTLLATFSSDGSGSKDDTSETPVLYEFSTLISDPGSQRQVVHPDNPIQLHRGAQLQAASEPVLLTCFVALQDVQLEMGPTVWLPGTHIRQAHEQFFQNDASKDQLLQSSTKVLGVLPQGCCALYDSRVLHCGSANRSDRSRALFYFSFRNPKIPYPGNPASIRRSIGAAQYRLPQLQRILREYKSSGQQFELG